MNKNMNNQLTTNELLHELNLKLDSIKTHMPNGELKSILSHVESISKRQEKMSSDISELRKLLLNPEDGIVVRVNKNTEYRMELQDNESQMQQIISEHNNLKEFKANVTKILWIFITSAVASIVLLWQQMIGK